MTVADQPGYRQIFYLWLPLALSRVMMSIAGPIVSAGISRLPDPTIHLAAYGLTLAIAVLIESPIIMILSTSVAVVRGRDSYLLLRRFLFHLTLALTGLSLLVYFTPFYDFLFLRLISVPPAIAQAARPALQVMLLWPLAIGWRRLFQGILIRHGRSKLVSYGTIYRLIALMVIVAVGVRVNTIPGAVVGGLALMISVIVELLIISWWTLPLIRERILPVLADPAGDAPMDYSRLARFYLPLAGTEMMRVASQPVTAASIARAADSTLSLAAWPVAFGLSSLFSSSAIALQETVLALAQDEESQRRLTVFSLGVGLALSSLLALIAFTPLLAQLYFRLLLDVPLDVETLAIPTTRIMIALPLLFAARDFLRGILIWRRQPSLVQLAMMINLFALIIFLAMGIYIGGVNGAILAAWATLAAYILEVITLWRLGR